MALFSTGAAVVALLVGCGGSDPPATEPIDRPPPRAAKGLPNLIVVMTDDQTRESFGPEAMPYAWKLFNGERGTIFEEAIAVPPLCCPSRAGFLTGQYPHNHGVLGNVPGYADLVEKDNVLPVWIARAGYRTALVGKYLNGYAQVAGPTPAPGWDSWFAYHLYPSYFDYDLSDGGEVSRGGDDRADYSTFRLTDRAVTEISDPERDRPLFMWLAHNAPHVAESDLPPCKGEVATPPSRKAYRQFEHAELPRDAAYDEADRSDKPRAIADSKPLKASEEEEIELRWRCALASLRPVDEGMEELVTALERAGELERTVLVFLSDNGYFYGEHARSGDKRLPYGASARIPMAMRIGSEVQASRPPKRVGQIAGTLDLAPTLLDFARAEPCAPGGACRAVDGRSLRPLLRGDSGAYPADRALLLELDEPDAYAYEALRTERYLYSRLHRDRGGTLPRPAIELYDLAADPHELENLWATRRARVHQLATKLAARLDTLARCRGSEQGLFARVKAPGNCD